MVQSFMLHSINMHLNIPLKWCKKPQNVTGRTVFFKCVCSELQVNKAIHNKTILRNLL